MAVRRGYSWQTNRFFGGYSDDRFLGPAGSGQEFKGIEVRRNPRSIKLANLSEKVSASIVTDLVLDMVTVSSSGDILAFGDTGKIYRSSDGGSTWINVYTMAGNLQITNAFEYNNYVYWATQSNIHRMQISGIDDDWTTGTTPSINYKTFTNGADVHPMEELNNKLYVGDKGYLAELDNLGVWSPSKIEIFGDEKIVGFGKIGSNLRFYTIKTSNVQYSSCYFWNGVDVAYGERFSLGKINVHCVTSKGDVDYIVAGKQPIIFASNGYKLFPLKRFPGPTLSNNISLKNNAIDTNNDFVLFGIGSGTGSIGRGVWTWGAITKNFSDSLVFEYPNSNDNNTDTVGCVHDSNGDIFQSWSDGVNYGIDKVNYSKYYTGGTFITQAQGGTSVHTKKEIQRMNAAFQALSAGEQIDIEVRRDITASWETVITATNSTHANLLSEEIEKLFDSNSANILEFRVTLTAGTSQLTTPEFFEIKVDYDEVEETV